jgi:iron complex transport system substrate-binding protein
MRKILLILMTLVISSALLVSSCSTESEVVTPATRTIVDTIGRTVEVPYEVNRVATLVGPSYDKVFMLGEKDKIAMLGFAQTAWAEKINPDLADIPTAANAKSPNIEELLNLDVDAVFTWSDAEPLEAMSNAGIPALSSLTSASSPVSADEYINGMKEEVRLYAEVLGQNALSKAEKYCDYLDNVIERVTSVTSKLAEGEKPKVYYIRGPEVLTTHGKYSNTRWYVEMAGGNMLSKDLEPTIASVDIEQVIAWDPDIIMMGRLGSTDPVMSDPAWSTITAVKTGNVYVNPHGVFYWDYGSEGALFLMYLAKTFHPDKFTDIDMVKEVKDYYSEFYGYQLTDEQANKILQHMDP